MKRVLVLMVMLFCMCGNAWGLSTERSGLIYYPTDGASLIAINSAIESRGYPATIKLTFDGSGVSKAYVLTSGVTFSDLVTLEFENGAILVPASGVQISFDPSSVKARDSQQIVDDQNSDFSGFAPTKGGRISLGWFGLEDGGNVTPSWQSALYATNWANSMQVVIPPGNYSFSSYTGNTSLNTKLDNNDGSSVNGFYLYGSGATIIYDDIVEASKYFLEVGESDNIYIDSINVDGNVGTKGNTGNPLVAFFEVDNFEVKNSTIINAAKESIIVSDNISDLEPSRHGRIINCILNGSARNGIALTGCEEILIDNCTISDCGQVNGTAPQYGIDLEAVGADVKNIEITRCTMQNNADTAIGNINSNFQVRNIDINQCYLEVDNDDSSNYLIFTAYEAENIVVRNCDLYGYSYIQGEVSFYDNTFYTDSNLAVAFQLRFAGSGSAYAWGDIILEGNTFDLTDAADKMISIDTISGAPKPLNLQIRNNTFRITGSTVSGQDIISLNPSFKVDDIMRLEGNKFEHSGSTPASPNYLLITSDGGNYLAENNVFSDHFRLDSTTGWNQRYSGNYGFKSQLIQTKVNHLDLTSTTTWTNAIPAGAIVLGIRAELTEDVTMSGGGTAWRQGDGSDVDRWGTTVTLTTGEVLNNADWTADTSAFLETSATSLVFTPDTGAFTAGEVDVQLIYSLPAF